MRGGLFKVAGALQGQCRRYRGAGLLPQKSSDIIILRVTRSAAVKVAVRSRPLVKPTTTTGSLTEIRGEFSVEITAEIIIILVSRKRFSPHNSVRGDTVKRGKTVPRQ